MKENRDPTLESFDLSYKKSTTCLYGPAGDLDLTPHASNFTRGW